MEEEIPDDIKNKTNLVLPNFHTEFLQKRKNLNFFQDTSSSFQKQKFFLDEESEQLNNNKLSLGPDSINSLKTQQNQSRNFTNISKFDKIDPISQNEILKSTMTKIMQIQNNEEPIQENILELQNHTNLTVPNFQEKYLQKRKNFHTSFSNNLIKQKLNLNEENEQQINTNFINDLDSVNSLKNQYNFTNLYKIDKYEQNSNNETQKSSMIQIKPNLKINQSSINKKLYNKQQEILNNPQKIKQKQQSNKSFNDEEDIPDDILEFQNKTNLILPNFQTEFLQKKKNVNFYQDNNNSIQKQKQFLEEESEQLNNTKLFLGPDSINSLKTLQYRSLNFTNVSRFDKIDVISQNESQKSTTMKSYLNTKQIQSPVKKKSVSKYQPEISKDSNIKREEDIPDDLLELQKKNNIILPSFQPDFISNKKSISPYQDSRYSFQKQKFLFEEVSEQANSIKVINYQDSINSLKSQQNRSKNFTNLSQNESLQSSKINSKRCFKNNQSPSQRNTISKIQEKTKNNNKSEFKKQETKQSFSEVISQKLKVMKHNSIKQAVKRSIFKSRQIFITLY
ncbi:hypothetical protein ABPG73_023017 [Tetrahymena malaccensis]